MRRFLPVSALATAATAALLLGGCSSATQSNDFVDALNSAQQAVVDMSVTVGTAQTPQEVAKAIDKALPKVQQRTEQVQAAQADLPENLQGVGSQCVASMQAITASLEALSSAAADKDQQEVEQAADELDSVSSSFDSDCVDPYNTAIGQN